MDVSISWFEIIIAFGVWFNVCLQYYDIIYCRFHDCPKKKGVRSIRLSKGGHNTKPITPKPKGKPPKSCGGTSK